MYIIPEISNFVFLFAVVYFNGILANQYDNRHGYGQPYKPSYYHDDYKPETGNIGNEHISTSNSMSNNNNNNNNNNKLLEDIFKLYSTRYLYNDTQIGPQIKPPQQQYQQQPPQQQQKPQQYQQHQQQQPQSSQQFPQYQPQYPQQQYPYEQQQQQPYQQYQQPYQQQQYQPQGYPQQYDMYQVYSFQQPQQQHQQQQQQQSPQQYKLKLMPVRELNSERSNEGSSSKTNNYYLNKDYGSKPQQYQHFMHPQMSQHHPMNYHGPAYDIKFLPDHYQSVNSDNWDSYSNINEDCDKEVECCNKCKCGGTCSCGATSPNKKCCCGNKSKKRETNTEELLNDDDNKNNINNNNFKNPYDL